MDILEHAHDILYKRAEEKERQYGSFQDSLNNAAKIASGMTGKTITPEDVSAVMIAMKLSREAYKHKYDNMLDAIVYLAQLNDSRDANT